MKQLPYPVANPYKAFARPEPEFFFKRFKKVFLQSPQLKNLDSKVYCTFVKLESPPQPEYYDLNTVLHLFNPIDGFSREEFNKGCGNGKYSIHLCPSVAKQKTIKPPTSHVAQLPTKPLLFTLKTHKKSDDLELSDIPVPKKEPILLEPSDSMLSGMKSFDESSEKQLSYRKIIGVQCLDSDLSYKKINNSEALNCQVIERTIAKQTTNTPIKTTTKAITKKYSKNVSYFKK